MASDGAIKAIDPSTIHQIQSGQVIVDLCSVAKELVENALDAGATTIDVRFKNQGLDSIEVQDNGSGISSSNYESIALKHYTSKLSNYDDLSTLQTFGFRGEALSSLCALSHFTIVTCTQKEAPKATKLEFETSGKLKSTSVVSGQRGTTVSVENLFKSLPVRRRELERNIKREWGKVVNLLNQYACIQTSVKFTVSQQPTKGKRMVLFSTKGNPTTRENIINVFGIKTMTALIAMDLRLQLKPTNTGLLAKMTAQDDDAMTEVRICGHISRPAHGEGRQTPDRQMFYVNGRPCGLPQFAKVFNEVYRSYNSTQSPFIFADIQLDTHLYDVNVSPDKRTILLHDQGQMLDNLRESLIELFELQDVTIPVSHTQLLKGSTFRGPSTVPLGSLTPAREKDSRDASEEPGSSLPSNRPENGPQGNRATRHAVNEDSDEAVSDEDNAPNTLSTGPKTRAGPCESTPANTQASNLLARWLERKSEARKQPVSAAINANDSRREKSPVEKEPQSPKRARRYDTKDAESDAEQDTAEDNEHVENNSMTQDVVDDKEMDRQELTMPSIPPPTQPPIPKGSLLSISRPPKRSAQEEVATITIGGHSITSVIGSSNKRSRLSEGMRSVSLGSSPTKGIRTVPVPSFGGRLTQLFSASGGASRGVSKDLEMTTEDVEMVDEEGKGEENEEGNETEKGVDSDDEALFVSQTKDVPAVEYDDVDEQAEHSTRENSPADEEGNGPISGQTNQSVAEGDDNGEVELSEDAPSECCHHGDDDEEYIDEDEKKAKEEKKVQEMIKAAEKKANEPTEEGEKRSQSFVKGRLKRKDLTFNLIQRLKTSEGDIRSRMEIWAKHLPRAGTASSSTQESSDGKPTIGLDAADAEEKLSLKISKSDFAKMKIVGQFNLGFIIAVREASSSHSLEHSPSQQSPAATTQEDDELFIIDQHASDEKYNFERLQSTTTVQSQRLVQPKPLTLTAVEEEIILEHLPALAANGFQVRVDTSGESAVGSRCQLLSLPLSRETTFGVADLEELIFLLGDNPTSSATTAIPRPSKVRKMFAMRACRSSIMIGRALSRPQMEKVVRHMGEMEKPWNCPHGRPTMRHLCGLGSAFGEGIKEKERGWDEWEGVERERVDWKAWVREKREDAEEGEGEGQEEEEEEEEEEEMSE
ncbi:hypothetical protein GE21DRAFT_6247 [Neurospora crassa]|uniref:DNA mismatch repair protein PMS1 n=2 Tax=Neurospora crassa TaxID=5141 RepID=Q7SAM1_NEUCR|nr:DNA mismatch repair protein [Neurospora crassa OR74A]EAA33454.3 DNA mismatch repair protein [Neurospora crassa OR74A]KHE84414.1 hypothetical protein GE21DRAFT_6247 [Neurospora crassa]CAE85513.1 related to DNA mismatch repair protein PMS1 [Neurospora crassa]|eukprot:XP_962690.3 DNA mismatch repair protein [Neurospora crassa OR74A]